MGRSFRRHAPGRAPLALGTALLLLAVLVPAAASAASFARARAHLGGWHLTPRPLFPSHLPAAQRHVNVHVYTFQGIDYSVDFGAGDN